MHVRSALRRPRPWDFLPLFRSVRPSDLFARQSVLPLPPFPFEDPPFQNLYN